MDTHAHIYIVQGKNDYSDWSNMQGNRLKKASYHFSNRLSSSVSFFVPDGFMTQLSLKATEVVYEPLTQCQDILSSGPGSLTGQKRMLGTGGRREVEQLLRAVLTEEKDNRNPFPTLSVTSLYSWDTRDLIKLIHEELWWLCKNIFTKTINQSTWWALAFPPVNGERVTEGGGAQQVTHCLALHPICVHLLVSLVSLVFRYSSCHQILKLSLTGEKGSRM